MRNKIFKGATFVVLLCVLALTGGCLKPEDMVGGQDEIHINPEYVPIDWENTEVVSSDDSTGTYDIQFADSVPGIHPGSIIAIDRDTAVLYRIVTSASVSGNTVTAQRVGETTIRSGSNSFRVTVNGKYNTYREPCLQWGASKSTVKNFMSGYTMDSDQNNFLIYYGKSPVTFIVYSFKNSSLILSSLVIPIGAVSMNELIAFMAERYIYVTQDEANNYFGFISTDKKTIVYLQIETINSQLVYFISYAAASSSNSAPARHLKMLKKLSTSQDENRAEINSIMPRLHDAMTEMRPEQKHH